ncbi:hypothetical protein B0T16DRAFT_415041 [Cercophora newfieldiana]|uniref:Uncharacterized protein n=1 Tax=Cercophora newfieldiana TaxID=92897 RepID=A0AA40CMM4_9PEZI|nr:hypothetical protein B0T16DRAFT_415041 [Cercophora newfieldiana]
MLITNLLAIACHVAVSLGAALPQPHGISARDLTDGSADTATTCSGSKLDNLPPMDWKRVKRGETNVIRIEPPDWRRDEQGTDANGPKGPGWKRGCV